MDPMPTPVANEAAVMARAVTKKQPLAGQGAVRVTLRSWRGVEGWGSGVGVRGGVAVGVCVIGGGGCGSARRVGEGEEGSWACQ